MRFGILRVHRILRRPRVRVTTIDPTGRPGLIRYSFRDTARTRSVLANPDPRFATTQRTSLLQFPLLLGWVSLRRLLQMHQVAQSIAHFGSWSISAQSRSDSGGAHVWLIFLNSRSPGPDYRSSQCWPIGKHQGRRGPRAHVRPPDSEMPRWRKR